MSGDFDFEPERYERELLGIIRAIRELEQADTASLERILRDYPKDGKGFFSKSEIISGFRHFAHPEGWTDETEFLNRVRMRPIRTLSGVTPVTVLTKPFPCPGRCVFCPNDTTMPKSYLADEPGAQRAANCTFDPYIQAFSRLEVYHQIGHGVDKVELIVLGGTWSHYPEEYQIGFVTRLFEALNDFSAGRDRRKEIERAPLDYRAIPPIDSRQPGAYNQTVRAALRKGQGGELIRDDECADWGTLERVQRENEHAASRCVGLVLETRPDSLDAAEVTRLRRLGATKIQIGYQSLADDVLRANRRGHDVAASREATRLLRSAGFKIHAHWMPNLLGSDPKRDIDDFAALFRDPDFRPDELKVYPCSLIAGTELETHYHAGRWQPYAYEELLEVLSACLAETPEYCRLTRVIRDIPSPDILVGNKLTNFREIAERFLDDAAIPRRDIRSREIRSNAGGLTLELDAQSYETSVGTDWFLQFITPERRIAGFARLTLPAQAGFLDELCGKALLREVHVYGPAADVGERVGHKAQHAGLGRALVEAAATRAVEAGFESLSVISAVGTRAYYRKLGFEDGVLYQHLGLSVASAQAAQT